MLDLLYHAFIKYIRPIPFVPEVPVSAAILTFLGHNHVLPKYVRELHTSVYPFYKRFYQIQRNRGHHPINVLVCIVVDIFPCFQNAYHSLYHLTIIESPDSLHKLYGQLSQSMLGEVIFMPCQKCKCWYLLYYFAISESNLSESFSPNQYLPNG